MTQLSNEDRITAEGTLTGPVTGACKTLAMEFRIVRCMIFQKTAGDILLVCIDYFQSS